MDLTTSASATITCAYPGCGSLTTIASAFYIDGLGSVCEGCHNDHFGGWVDALLGEIEPPF